MAALVIIAKNQTGSPITLVNFDLVLPASPGTLTLTDALTTSEIYGDPQLQDLVALGTVVLNDGTNDLDPAAAYAVGHGIQTDPGLHAAADGSNAGFMQPAQVTKLAAYPATPASIDHSTLTGLTTGDAGHTTLQLRSEKGVANGYASLDGTGKVPASQLTLSGAFVFQGVWNASTNTPTLTSGVGTQGHLYRVSVAGSTNLDGITDWQVGDNAWFDGTVWRKDDNTDSVTSVNGQTGAAVLAPGDLVPAGDAAGTARPPTAHASTHVDGGSDEIAGDALASAFSPTNYTPTSQTIGGQFAGIDSQLTDLLAGDEFFSGYDNSGGTSINPGPVTVPYGARHIITSAFTHTLGSGEVTLGAGNWLIDADVSVDNAVSSSRTVAQCWLEVDTGGGFAEWPGSRAFTYNRVSSAGENSGHIGLVLVLTGTATVRVRVQRISGSANLTLRDEGSRLRIAAVRGPQGPAGPPGTAGITLEDDGATVTGGPHDTINVTGILTTVTDAGGGEATLDVRLPFFASFKNDSEQSTTGTLTVATLNFTAPRAGTYQLNYSAELYGTVIGAYQRMEVEVDGTDIAFIEIPAPRINTTENWPSSGFDVQSLTAGSHTMTVILTQAAGGGSAQIRRIRLSVEEKA